MRARILAVCLAAALGAALAVPAQAEGIDNLKAGVIGLITFPADFVMGAVDPPKAATKLPGAVVTGPVVGFFSGIVMGVYRVSMAVVDISLSPFWVFPTLSPEPRFENLKDEVEYN